MDHMLGMRLLVLVKWLRRARVKGRCDTVMLHIEYEKTIEINELELFEHCRLAVVLIGVYVPFLKNSECIWNVVLVGKQ